MANKNQIAKVEKPTYGFPVGSPGDRVPAIGETGTAKQFCPIIRDKCMKQDCMLWVELFVGEQRVAHCAYYWDALQRVDIKSQLIRLNENIEKITPKEKKGG